jgi:hypothetical protein
MRVKLITAFIAGVTCSSLLAETKAPIYLGIDAKGVRHESKGGVHRIPAVFLLNLETAAAVIETGMQERIWKPGTKKPRRSWDQGSRKTPSS